MNPANRPPFISRPGRNAAVGALLAALVLTALFAPRAGAQTVIFTETNFAPAGWTYYAESDGGGTGSALQVASGGNPGAYLSVTNISNNDNVVSYVFFTAAVFDPSTSGAITSLAGSFDSIDFSWGQGVAIAVRQGGVNYSYVPADSTYPTSWSSSASWSSLPATGFIPFGQSTHPDFSSTGGPIEFGVIVGNGGGYGVRTTLTGIDNFSVTVNFTAVPEPSTWLLLLGGAGLLGLTHWSTRRSRPCRSGARE